MRSDSLSFITTLLTTLPHSCHPESDNVILSEAKDLGTIRKVTRDISIPTNQCHPERSEGSTSARSCQKSEHQPSCVILNAAKNLALTYQATDWNLSRMSQIDQYQHECIGIANCPSTYEFVYLRPGADVVLLYRLIEDAPDWHAKAGDLLLGGGRGEAAAFRLSMPEALFFNTRDDWDDFENLDPDIRHAYWPATQAFMFCEGYAKLGWHPDKGDIEAWLEGHILAFILREYPETYEPLRGPLYHIEQDGSLLTPPTDEDKELYRYKLGVR
jgi:hypothetical protein